MATRRAPAASTRTPAIPAAAQGFTAMELLVVLSIVAILASIAMPSFAAFTANQRLRTAAYDLMADLTFTRGEAVKRNNRVTINRVGASWAGGWSVLDDQGAPLRTHSPLESSVVETTGPATVTFGLDGRQVGSATATFTFGAANADAAIPARRIIVDPSGRPRSL